MTQIVVEESWECYGSDGKIKPILNHLNENINRITFQNDIETLQEIHIDFKSLIVKGWRK